MNCKLIELPKHQAREKFIEYRDAVRQHNRKEDAELMRGFRALSKGQKLIDVHDAMKFAGLNEKHQPKLAICRADATYCHCDVWPNGRAEFFMDEKHRWTRVSKHRVVKFPARTFDNAQEIRAKAIVPSIPPRLRPAKISYSKLHILWEAEWETVPTDPMLLRHLGGALYVVLACWDLTDLERAVLKRAL